MQFNKALQKGSDNGVFTRPKGKLHRMFQHRVASSATCFLLVSHFRAPANLSRVGTSGPVKLAAPTMAGDKPAADAKAPSATKTTITKKTTTKKAPAVKKAPAAKKATATKTATKKAPAAKKAAPKSKTTANTGKARKTPAAVCHGL